MNYVNIVIKPLDNATNAVTVQAKPGKSTKPFYLKLFP